MVGASGCGSAPTSRKPTKSTPPIHPPSPMTEPTPGSPRPPTTLGHPPYGGCVPPVLRPCNPRFSHGSGQPIQPKAKSPVGLVRTLAGLIATLERRRDPQGPCRVRPHLADRVGKQVDVAGVGHGSNGGLAGADPSDRQSARGAKHGELVGDPQV